MTNTDPPGTTQELDLRELDAPERHRHVLERYAQLPVEASLLLVDDRDPHDLRHEFESEHPGSHEWEQLASGPGRWRIRLTKMASTPLPRLLLDTRAVAGRTGEPGVSGAVWNIPARERDLDSNIISLEPGGSIDAYAGPELDVLIHVLGGEGTLGTERGDVPLSPGSLVWLPRRSRRSFAAGPGGLRYLTVHQRRQSLVLRTTRPDAPA
ncbi:MAG: DUF2249 domain-containing protein [Arthrobacter sp.]|uniref:DUF2249 domain-containing protein n=1 Tax=unclassified Arthrobacter TaxID=235627 RepID=UPI00264AF5E1|nr:DUF2249 domain-containing protein [Micrococcaceae bacterium]MDN5878342.1 DUF2249 domain-containing protein [Micrococcaceae bacterium]MDN5885943.1 DUF2249 domain-containing protein [Micrococcaceae bacterium]MDN6169635.1 DUF2249 domain-containing protein [Micrococcaceae bacterium]MDN6298805.1 DUF2249 domain-containing protein [Micrococcaceae bacterium]